jgi:hypothetical protein
MGRKFVCAALAVALPVSLMADDSSAAILHHNGGTLLNGNPAPPASAIFPNDTVQTQSQHEATINAAGSAVTVVPETLVQFEGDELVLDHGTVLVGSSRGLRVRVGCITVIPATPAWTQYDVTDVDGKVTVAARKSDVNIESRDSKLQAARSGGRSERVSVHEGEQKTRDEKCGVAQQPPDHLAAKGAILNSPWAIGAGAGGILFGTCWEFCRSDDPLSPSKP